MTSSVTNVKVSRDEKAWEVEVHAEIPQEALAKFRKEALKEIQKTAKLDGFRVGHAPEARILEVYGEGAVMRHAVEHAIEHELPELFAKENLFIVDSPKVTTESPSLDKPLKFSARAPLAPTVELADYKTIAKEQTEKKEEIAVSDEEHTEAMMHLRRERARIDKIEAGAEQQKAAEEARGMKAEDLPTLDDTFVQSLGYESAEKFSEVLRSNIKSEKELRAREKIRAAILDTLVEKSTVRYPAMLREYELDEMEARVKDDLQRGGQTIEGYLAETKKTREELRKTWEPAAEKRAKVRLILAEIARKEKIEPNKEQLEKEMEHAKKRYPAADPNVLRTHITHALRNEAVLHFLEGLL